jgi:hypothetical protein
MRISFIIFSQECVFWLQFQLFIIFLISVYYKREWKRPRRILVVVRRLSNHHYMCNRVSADQGRGDVGMELSQCALYQNQIHVFPE